MSSMGFAPLTAPPHELIRSLNAFSPEALGELRLYIQNVISGLAISQIPGFSQFTLQAAEAVATVETTSSASYGDLATVGPSLTGLPDGKYAAFFGATGSVEAADIDACVMYMGIRANGNEASDAQAAAWTTTATGTLDTTIGTNLATPGARVIVGTLAGGGTNTLTARYRWERTTDGGGTSGPGSFGNRWLVALRIANP